MSGPGSPPPSHRTSDPDTLPGLTASPEPHVLALGPPVGTHGYSMDTWNVGAGKAAEASGRSQQHDTTKMVASKQRETQMLHKIKTPQTKTKDKLENNFLKKSPSQKPHLA